MYRDESEGMFMPHRPGPPWGGGHSWGHAWGSGSPLISTLTALWWLLLLAGLAWLAWWWLGPHLRPWLTSLFAHETATPSALELLRRRYASGEIDSETFEHMQERLEASYDRRITSDSSGYQRYRQREMSKRRAQRGLYLLPSGAKTSKWEHSNGARGERTHRPVSTHRSASSRQEALKRGR
jgi:putative membrane protein